MDWASVLKVVVMEVVTDFVEEVRNGKPAPVGEVVFENLIKTFWCEKIIFKNVNIMNFWCRIVKSYKIGAKL